MTKYTHRLGAGLFGALALIACTTFTGCKAEQKQPDTTALGADSALNRDLALANHDTTAQPQLKDVPANAPSTAEPRREPTRREPRPEPRRAAPAPSNPGPTVTSNGNVVTSNAPGANAGGGAVGTIAAGSELRTHSNARVCTNTNAVGDRVSATLDNSVTGSNGAVIPSGATVHLTVTQLKRSENSNDPIVMEFAVNSVSFGGHTYPIDGTVESAAVDRIKDQPQSKDVQKVAIGAVAGAIAGRIIGHSTKGTVIGGAVGAAGGVAAAAATANYQGCVASGGSIVVKLNSGATVRAG